MGIANAQRTLDYIRIITEFISQPEWTNVVPMFSVMNEPEQIQHIGNSTMYSFYLKVHDMIREITGVGEGPFIVISDGWGGVGSGSQWNSSILNGADRIALDTHIYYAFDTPLAYPAPLDPCTRWAANVNVSKGAFGVTIVGEFTAGFNTCGRFVKGVNQPPSAALNCELWMDHTSWNESTINDVLDFTLSSMDASQDYFFRTWKIGNGTDGTVQSPLWSYQLGLQNGWIPKDPRTAISHCANHGAGGTAPFNGQFEPWQTGGAGAGVIASTFTAEYGKWPPNLNGGLSTPEAAPLLPMYTSTGTVATLPPPTLTASTTHSISVGDGWYDSSDTIGGVTAAAGCAYPNAWSAVSIAIPTVCGAAPATAAAYFTSPPTPR
ncbi:glycoside hydrolase family 5 protein [Athelia psychrophila]|uniref:glucan 1,3-beta-glucosidase n=1 Tax=Athelia psychrophila TaxID=1759441 RepID=A0A167UGP7_9AGAM|nr:glycoside hydrolase family 5 protein [Fibularhizoctonia sp. CBS 109695]